MIVLSSVAKLLKNVRNYRWSIYYYNEIKECHQEVVHKKIPTITRDKVFFPSNVPVSMFWLFRITSFAMKAFLYASVTKIVVVSLPLILTQLYSIWILRSVTYTSMLCRVRNVLKHATSATFGWEAKCIIKLERSRGHSYETTITAKE
jgi:hypothetical protein